MSEKLSEATEWFWRIVDEAGLADVPSDEQAALRLLVQRAARAEARPAPAVDREAVARVVASHVRKINRVIASGMHEREAIEDAVSDLLALLSPAVDREAVALLERTASWIEATIPRLTDLNLRAEAARDADALRALLSPATSPGEGSSGAESARTGTLPVLTEGQHSAGGGKIPGVEEVIRYLRNYGPGTPDTTDLYFMRWAADHLCNLVSREAFWRSQAQTSEAG